MAQDDVKDRYSNLEIITTALIIITIASLSILLSGFFLKEVYGQGNKDLGGVITRGGGMGSITCPTGSTKQAVIAFVVVGNSNNSKITTTNWNINELPTNQNLNPGFASGSFNSVDLNPSKYKITGQKINEVHLCEPPLSLPITVTGSCGQNVVINVQFQSNDPILTTGGTFTGDVTCSQKGTAKR
jgi:hypothetical protein